MSFDLVIRKASTQETDSIKKKSFKHFNFIIFSMSLWENAYHFLTNHFCSLPMFWLKFKEQLWFVKEQVLFSFVDIKDIVVNRIWGQ